VGQPCGADGRSWPGTSGSDLLYASPSVMIRSHAPLGDSKGTTCRSFLTVGAAEGMSTRVSLRCAMSKANDHRSSAGEVGEDRGSGDGSVTTVCDTDPMVNGNRYMCPLCAERAPRYYHFLTVERHDGMSACPCVRCDISASHDDLFGRGHVGRLQRWEMSYIWHAHHGRYGCR